MTRNDKILEKIAILAIKHMSKHNLIKKYWKFGFDNTKTAFGCCDFTNRTITLSKPLCICNKKNMNAILDTILHEIAHAITFHINPNEKPHGKLWKDTFIAIGGNGKTKVTPEDKIKLPKGKYVYQCPNCHGTTEKHYKNDTMSCEYCCEDYNDGEWSEKYVCNLIITRDNIPDGQCY